MNVKYLNYNNKIETFLRINLTVEELFKEI